MLFRLFIYSYILTCWLPFTVLAAPALQVKIDQEADHKQFTYTFFTPTKMEQLQFAISNQTLAEHFRSFRRYQPSYLQQYIWRDMQLHAATYPGVKLQRLRNTTSLSYQLSGSDPITRKQLSAELSNLISARQNHYLQQMYYSQFRFADGQVGIVPDHLRIVLESLPDLAPIAQAIKQQQSNLSSRQMLQYISHWLQQIPYQDLSDRQHSSGTSFNVPLKLLAENRGDCDSKAVLLAALIKLIYPELKQAIVYLPNHAMLAIAIKPLATDSTTLINGQVYVLVDATGPALLKVGEINPQYQLYMTNGYNDYRLF
ncbi:hypothetical protein [Rheinheimera sp. MMS21-TC3]|uniref:hypothetical protein n=1 Tax=Rheinheimera sp. MMS21-TC3 TaxID=3072790 RepID=UPI0028C4E27F|nr:hypothetical protein [Rheinheimera sp. MMS21-TC3]WNO62133.1 hypothetical protein RDV63_14590 [Rheinheimera sp. MMS21-TC3]